MYLVKYNVWFSIYLDSSIGMILCQWLDLELDQCATTKKIYTSRFHLCVFIQLFCNKAHYGNKLHLLDAEIGIILWEFKQLVRASIDIRWSLKLQII